MDSFDGWGCLIDADADGNDGKDGTDDDGDRKSTRLNSSH